MAENQVAEPMADASGSLFSKNEDGPSICGWLR